MSISTRLPHLSKDAVDQSVAEIMLMPFFPANDAYAKALLIRYFFDMCYTDEQALWLAKRYTTLFTKWSGVRELRAVASAKFKPKDGIEVYSETYMDGIPSEKPEGPRLLDGPLHPESRKLLADLMKSTELPR